MDVSMNVSGQDSQISDDQNNTQPISQPQLRPEDDLDAQCWGLLLPCTPGLERVRFLKTKPEITVGRDSTRNVVLNWTCVSGLHAKITWNGEEDGKSVVTIVDHSSNGTYLKGQNIGRNNARLLSDGNEISFGPGRRPGKDHTPEYRYIYRDLVSERRELYKKYDLSVELGHGTYARVYKALQKGTSRWVAVKVIHQTMRLNLTPSGDSGLIREISIMRTLRHSNICTFLDYFENENKSIDIVLEYMDGGDLGTYIMRHNGFGLGDWLSCHITYQICQAVVYIHSHNITHRDLKPENILLSLSSPPIVKIADFGLAKLVNDRTGLKTMCGTPTFMAPEIVTRLSTDSPYTNLVDSWSVGAIVFAMFTTQTPFPKVATLELKGLMISQLIDWVPLDNTKGITENGKRFVRQLLEFDPAHRMSLVSAQEHPWLAGHKQTYAMEYSAEGQSLTRTASLNSGISDPSGPPQRPVLARAVTEDPYADDYPQPPPPRKLRTPPPAQLDTIAEVMTRLPGLHLAARRSTPPESSVQPVRAGNNLLQPANGGQTPLDSTPGYVQDSTYEKLYARAPMPDLQPGPASALGETSEMPGGAQKRIFAEIEGSSPLSSVSSSPPAKKKARKGKTKGKAKASTAAESKPDTPASSNPRKAKGKKKEESGMEKTTAVRRSNRPARPVKR